MSIRMREYRTRWNRVDAFGWDSARNVFTSESTMLHAARASRVSAYGWDSAHDCVPSRRIDPSEGAHFGSTKVPHKIQRRMGGGRRERPTLETNGCREKRYMVGIHIRERWLTSYQQVTTACWLLLTCQVTLYFLFVSKLTVIRNNLDMTLEGSCSESSSWDILDYGTANEVKSVLQCFAENLFTIHKEPLWNRSLCVGCPDKTPTHQYSSY